MDPEPKHAAQSQEETRTYHSEGSGVSEPVLEEWGHLRILEEIGRGGFGSVYRAFDPTLEREVALKVFHAVAKGSDLRDEGRQLAKLRHANVVQVYGVDVHGGRAGLWMEFVHGRTLSRLLRDQGRLGAHEATAIALEVCRAVAAVHASGLVHRDIKAQNVMREDGGRIVLMDFGLTGPQTKEGSMSGTPVCMAPELLRGQPASAQSDIYSLGVLLYYLVTASYPYDANTFRELALLHQEGRMKLLTDLRQDLPAGFVRTVERAMASRPEDRFATVGQLARALTEADREPPPPTVSRPKRRRTREAVVALALLLGVAGAAAWFTRGRARSPAPAAQVLGVAVLPFDNLTGDPKNDYLGEGIAEEIAGWLGRSSQLRVIARNSTRQFRGSRDAPAQIGKKLNAQWLITGSVRRDDSRLRVAVQAVRTSDGVQQLSDTGDYDLKNRFAVEERIGGSLASLLRVQLDAAPAKLNPESRELYWLAEQEGQQQSPGHLRAAAQLMERVVEREPRYVPAITELASIYGTLGFMGGARTDSDKASGYAEQAVRIDGGYAKAHLILGFLKSLFAWDWKGAEQEFRMAAALDPRGSAGNNAYASLLMMEGRLDEARTQYNLLEQVDPLSYQLPHGRSMIAVFEGRFADAERESDRAIAMSPDNPLRRSWRGYIHVLTGHYAEGVADLEQAMKMSGSLKYRGDLGWAYGRTGRAADARRMLATLEADPKASLVEVAAVYAGLGELDRSLDWLEKALPLRDPALRELWMDPVWAPMRQLARYKALVARIFNDAPLKAPPR